MKVGKNGSIASKKTMNLAVVEKKEINVVQVVITAVVVFVLLVVVAKFGILDRYNAVTKAKNEYQEQVDLYNTLVVSNADYDDVLVEFNRYSFGAMTDEERAVADRGEVLNLIEKYLIPSGNVQAVSLSGNQLAVQMSGVTLEEASSLINILNADELVSTVTVATATSNGNDNGTTQSVTTDGADGEETETTAPASKAMNTAITFTISLADNSVGIEASQDEGGEQ